MDCHDRTANMKADLVAQVNALIVKALVDPA